MCACAGDGWRRRGGGSRSVEGGDAASARLYTYVCVRVSVYSSSAARAVTRAGGSDVTV